jgi:hypothetical protein
MPPHRSIKAMPTWSDKKMAAALDRLYGPRGWVHDPDGDVWVVPDKQHQGPGKAYYVLRRNCEWRRCVVPEEMVQ